MQGASQRNRRHDPRTAYLGRYCSSLADSDSQSHAYAGGNRISQPVTDRFNHRSVSAIHSITRCFSFNITRGFAVSEPLACHPSGRFALAGQRSITGPSPSAIDELDHRGVHSPAPLLSRKFHPHRCHGGPALHQSQRPCRWSRTIRSQTRSMRSTNLAKKRSVTGSPRTGRRPNRSKSSWKGHEETLCFPNGTCPADTKWKCLLDPIDGTRGIMYDKRSAWALSGIAPQRGEATRLSDIVVAAMTELPTTKQWRADQVSAHARRRYPRRGLQRPGRLNLAPLARSFTRKQFSAWIRVDGQVFSGRSCPDRANRGATLGRTGRHRT